MLGLADRGRVIDLFEALMQGDIAAALAGLSAQYDAGADPAVVLSDLASFTHLVTRLKLVPAAADDAVLTDVERTRGLIWPLVCLCVCCREPGRFSCAGCRRFRLRRSRLPPLKWCWCASLMPPIFLRRKMRCAPCATEARWRHPGRLPPVARGERR